ncbi:MAG: hypothetical protein IJA17_05585 [Oscillospiraceae bacterium]|nr:hypothetical protein [Oscillospiraceae bacterium]
MKLYDLIIKEISDMGIAVEAKNGMDAARVGNSRCLLKVKEKENPEDKNICMIRLIIEEARPDIDDFIYKENDDPNAALRKNVKVFCKLLNADSFFTEEELEDMIDELPWDDFEPMKEIEFEDIYTFKADATFVEPFIVKHGPIFDKRGVRVSVCQDRGYMGASDIIEGVELWLLEDMTFAATHFCHMEVRDDPRNEEAIYRYPVDIKEAVLDDLYVDDFLEDMQFIME